MSSLTDDRVVQAEMLRRAHERLQAKFPDHPLLNYYDVAADGCSFPELEVVLTEDFSDILSPVERQLHVMAAYTKAMEDALQVQHT